MKARCSGPTRDFGEFARLVRGLSVSTVAIIGLVERQHCFIGKVDLVFERLGVYRTPT